MKEKLRKPLTALMMAWGTYLAIPCPYKVWDDALRPWQIVCLPPVGLVVGGIWALCAGIFAKLDCAMMTESQSPIATFDTNCCRLFFSKSSLPAMSIFAVGYNVRNSLAICCTR